MGFFGHSRIHIGTQFTHCDNKIFTPHTLIAIRRAPDTLDEGMGKGTIGPGRVF